MANTRPVLARLTAGALFFCAVITGVEGNEDPSLIVVRDDRVSVRLEGTPLGQVLDAIEQKLDMRISLPASLADRSVWSSFDDLSIDSALARLLTGVSYIVSDDADLSSISTGKIRRRVYVLSTGATHNPEDDSSYALGSANQASAWIKKQAGGGSDRRLALIEAYESGNPGVERAVETALVDRDLSVREGAFELVAYTTPVTEIEAERKLVLIEQIANAESDAELRIEAMYVLSDRAPDRAEPVVRQALSDKNSKVRSEAEVLLEAIQLELATRR